MCSLVNHLLVSCECRHVLSVHSGASRAKGVSRGPMDNGSADADDTDAPIDEKTLKRFIKYARTHNFPRLAEQSAGKLVDKFVELRDKVLHGALVCALQCAIHSPCSSAA